MKQYSVLTFCLTIPVFLFGQQPSPADTVKREAVIRHHVDDNKVDFSADTPPLQQIPGAPKAFYEFYWELGDGNYSLEKEPSHTYQKAGEYNVRLWTTNNYDNGKPPPSRPQKVQIKKITYEYTAPQVLPETEIFNLKNNREPVPEEEMVMIISYRNETDHPVDGKLYLFFNEKKFKADNFTLQEVRTHHGERTVPDEPVAVACILPSAPSALWASLESFRYQLAAFTNNEDLPLSQELEADRTLFSNSHILEFDAMAPGESRNVFYSFQTTPEMVKDTSAVIKVKGVYVPNRNENNYRKKELEMEIVTSHDPNKMSVSDTRLNYRTYRNKALDFKVRFQNNGEGPARSIKLNVDVPEMYDKHSLNIIDLYPPCPVCPDGEEVSFACLDTLFTSDQITFHFKNIYLPGSNQKNVEERDSTKGFVKYSLKFNSSIDKKRTVSRTAIIFDKNEPVITNYATTRFKPGLSIGAKAGYNYFPVLSGSKNFFAGITLSPYKSQHGYFQIELMGEYHSFSDSDSTHNEVITPIDGAQGFYDVFETSRIASYKNTVITLVPVSYRYSLSNVVGLGAGVQLSTNMTGKIEQNGTVKYSLFIETENARQRDPKRDRVISSEKKASGFSELDTGLFGDITVGSSRIGPTLGVRYIYHFNDPHIQYQFYALWKF